MTFQVCHACTAQRAVDALVCPHCGHDQPGTLDHDVDQVLVDYGMTMDDLRGIVQEGGPMPASKINRQEGVSYPLNRPGEGAPRFGGEGGSMEYGGREPAEEEVGEQQPAEVDEQSDTAPQLERPKDSDTKDKWLAYGDQQDPDADNSSLTKVELIELYGG